MAGNTENSYLRSEQALSVPYTTLPEMIQKHSTTDPESVAQVFINWQTFEKQYLTFTEIYNSASMFARGLLHLGVKKGDMVALGTDNTPKWTIALIGIQISGAIPLMFMFDRNDGSDIEALLSKHGKKCRAIIFPEGPDGKNTSIVNEIFQKGSTKGQIMSPSLPNVKWSIHMSDRTSARHFNFDDIFKMGTKEQPLPYIDQEDIAAVFQTSGSTGLPKLLPHTHFFLLTAGFHQTLYHGQSSTSIVNDRPFIWMAGFPHWEIFTGRTRILIGHIADIPSVDTYHTILNKVLKEEHFESCFIVGSILHDMLQDKSTEWRLPNVLSGGQPLSRMLTRIASQRCERFTIGFGCSKTGYASCGIIDDDKEYRDYEAGIPLPGVELKVVDPSGTILKKGERGELYIRSTSRFPGYMNDKEKTNAAQTTSGWYKTDDSAIITQDDRLLVDGRISDSVVRTALGFQSLTVLEGKLKQHSAISNAVGITFLDDSHFRQICFAILSDPKIEITDTELVNYLLSSESRKVDFWDKITVPKNFVFFESFPKTYTGKINRKQIAAICKKVILERSAHAVE